MITIDIRKSEKLGFEYSAFVSFHYNIEIVKVMRSLPQKSYNPTNREWEMPINKISVVKEQLNDFDIDIIDTDNQLNKPEPEVTIPEGFKFKTEPFEHQKEAFMYGLKHDNWFLGDEMGLGKTKQSLDIAVARKLKYGYKHCLIVCGVNTLKWNWRNEIITHTNEAPWILGQKKTRDGKLVIGSTKDKINDLKWLLDNDTSTYFLITNVESFRDAEISKLVQKLCSEDIISMCIFDEAHKCKNPTSQQTKGFFRCVPKCKIAMTGTPLMNNPMDLYVILKWLGYETHSFYQFKNHYCLMGGFGGYEIVGYKNMEQLTAQINDIMLRRKKEDVYDLPEKIYIDEFVDMTPKQAVIYKEVESDIKSNIDMIDIGNNPLAALIRLRQATGYTGILSSTIQESAKLDRMEDLVDEALANDKKCLIFSNWTQMTDSIFDRLDSKGIDVAQITGNTPDNQRQYIVDKFQNSDDITTLIGTIGAMGTGLTLTAGTVIIFVDEPWNKALFEQAVDRAHRIGTTENITIYSIMCKNTIDERIHEIIYKKGIMSDAIIDGKIVGNKTEVFNYLLG